MKKFSPKQEKAETKMKTWTEESAETSADTADRKGYCHNKKETDKIKEKEVKKQQKRKSGPDCPD